MIKNVTARTAQVGQTFYHVFEKNADGTAVRCRVNGKCKTWKTRPGHYELPVKHGLHNCFYIRPGFNDGDWNTSDPTAD